MLVSIIPIGSEIQKAHPCIIISPDEMNQTIKTIIVAPMTTKSHPYPTRIPLTFDSKHAWIVLDQIRTIDKQRVVRILGHVDASTVAHVKQIINEMLVE
jgi:mRNA interferase MazF